MEEYSNPWQQLVQEPDPVAVPKFWLRKKANGLGGALLIYQVIMNIVVIGIIFAVTFAGAFQDALTGLESDVDALMEQAMAISGWGYMVAVGIGMLMLLLWKKPRFFRFLASRRRKNMTGRDFWCLLAFMMAPQVVAQLCNLGLLWLLEALGLDGQALNELGNADTSSLPMFLYVGILAPISEEILFRGLVQETVAPFGKKIAIWGAALLFGLYHGNPIQTPYAILVGLVLGYVSLEYHIGWAILLHMFNNLVFATVLPEALGFLPALYIDIILWALVLACFVTAVLILIRRWEEVKAWWIQDILAKWQMKAFFGAPTVVILMVLCGLSLVGTTLILLI